MPKQIHILLIGPITNVKENLIGGATISFGHLIDYLEANGEAFTVVNTKYFVNGFMRFLNPFLIVINVLLHISKADVLFLNSSRGGAKYLVPILVFLAKIFGRKFVFRPFGGNIKTYTSDYSPIWQWILNKSLIRTDLFFLQTKALVEYYKNLDYNALHLPTSRNSIPYSFSKKTTVFNKRFIYLGAITKTKGVDEIMTVSKQLPKDYTIHLYGPIIDQGYKRLFDEQQGIYKGILQKNEVLETLRNYDILILPTYYEGEGYPGVIIEAYSLGIPVITTNWLAIPEIVENGKTGQLINIQSSESLLKAMQYFNTGNYPDYTQNALALFQDKFDTEKVIKKALKAIKAIVVGFINP